MAKDRKNADFTTLQMALVGYEIERDRIAAKIREIEGLLKGMRPAEVPRSKGAKAEAPKRKMSAAARKRIALGQRKRWAEHRKRQAQGKK